MTALVFVDTNVLVYAYNADEPTKRVRAREWMDVLWREQRGRTSAQVLSEYFAVLTRKSAFRVAPEDAWDEVQALINWNPHPVDTELLKRAYEIERRFRLSWWDSLIVAAAQAQSCALLLTEDLQDGANYGGVIVKNPFQLGVAEEHSAYAAMPKVISRHRGRGRPRKHVRASAETQAR